MQNSITVIIHTHNEEKNLQDCIDSAKLLTNSIIIIDMESTDKTLLIAKKNKVTVFNFSHTYYVEPARKFGIKKSSTDWVLILDADERLSKPLVKEINKIINANNLSFTHYQIPRKNIFAGVKWLRYGGWSPDYQTRLINKKFFINWPSQIHSTPILKGQKGVLKESLVHYFHSNLSTMVDKTIIFEDIESNLLHQANKPVSNITFFRKFIAEVYRRLIKNTGIFDGTMGVIESIYQGFSKTITYLFLYEKQSTKK